MKEISRIINIFLIWRVALFIPLIFGSFLNYGSSFPFFELSYYKQLPDFLNYPIFTTWSNFDGVHYINIASRGYIGQARFFPLFPIIIFLFSLGNAFFPLTYLIALVIPNVIFVAALLMLHKLLRLDYPEKTSIQSIIYLLIFPTAFFFVSVYTEGLFLLLCISTFYFARKKNWKKASLTGMLLVLTRFVGIFIIPALIYEYFVQKRILKLKDYLFMFAMSLFVSSGLVIYSIFNYIKWGSFQYFLIAQGQLSNGRTVSGIVLPIQTVYRYFKILTSLSLHQFEWWLAFLEVFIFIIGSVLLFIAWKKKVRPSYLIFGTLAFLLPSLSGTFSGLPRYLLVIFPIFIALSLMGSKFVKVLYYIISGVFLFCLLMFFSRGYFIA